MADYGLLKAPENMTPQAQELLDRYMQRNKEIDREHNREMAKLYGGAALQIGSALIPGTLGLKVGSSAIKALTPYMGRKIAENVATGTISGLASGAVEGLGRGLLERENPIKTMLSDSALSALGGGAVGYMGGQLLKNLAKRGLQGNQLAQKQYWDDYVEGLSDNSRLGERSLLSKEASKYKALSQLGSEKLNGVGQFDRNNPLHVKQAELINKYNPANDSYHTWVRNADDINTFEDTLKDPAYIGDGDFDPSYSRDMALQAINDGEIDVYSSYPIDKGIFVTPSRMEAEMYAGGGEIYSKRVPLNDVAWIDPTQGQYAPIRELPNPVIKEEVKSTGKIPQYKESNYYKNRIMRREARQLNNETNGLYEKLMGMSMDLKAPKPIESKLKKEGEIVIMNKSLPFKDNEINYAISEITSNLSDIEKTEGYAVRKLGNDFIHLKYDKNGKHHLGKFGVDDSKYD